MITVKSIYPPVIGYIRNKYYLQPGWIEVSKDFKLSDVEWLLPDSVIKYDEEHSKLVTEDKEWKVKASRGNTEYLIKLIGGNFTCTCSGFGFRKKCKHIELIKKSL